MADLKALYQEVILDHSKNPRNFHSLPDADRTAVGRNPLCGDQFTVYLRMDGDTIVDIGFEGQGCAISKSSASMMTQLLKGKSKEEIGAIRTQFRDLMLGVPSPEDESRLGSLRALSGVARFPARVKCALLAWNALETALADSE